MTELGWGNYVSQHLFFLSPKPTKTKKKCIYNSELEKTRKTDVDNYLLSKHIKFQKDWMDNDGAILGKL